MDSDPEISTHHAAVSEKPLKSGRISFFLGKHHNILINFTDNWSSLKQLNPHPRPSPYQHHHLGGILGNSLLAIPFPLENVIVLLMLCRFKEGLNLWTSVGQAIFAGLGLLHLKFLRLISNSQTSPNKHLESALMLQLHIAPTLNPTLHTSVSHLPSLDAWCWVTATFHRPKVLLLFHQKPRIN